jgi:FkbH-like protein
MEALNIVGKRPPAGAEALDIVLACGFTPLHLQTFLEAHLRTLRPGLRVVIQTGLYGDCLGNVERLTRSRPDGAALVLEWADLDPRLGLRQLGGWGPSVLTDILRTVTAQLDRLQEAISRVARNSLVVVSLPTLPIPPLSHLPGRQSGTFDLALRDRLGQFAARIAELAGVRIVSPQRLDRESPASDRRDVKSELATDFPYRLPHASTVANLLAHLLCPPAPKKGLITDLDDTLWRGILGEVGVHRITWDLDHQSSVHGLYQQFLGSLGESGTLIGVASKNHPELVEEALRRQDLILPARSLFPVEVHWGPKSESVGRILRAWNIGAESVVFVDDSPMELAEVKAAYPEIEVRLFPARDDQLAYKFLEELRDLFGKEVVSEEDTIRQESLRRSTLLTESLADPKTDPDLFLKEAEAELTLDDSKDTGDPRALELINKTNQFNLNGKRFTPGRWRGYLEQADAFVLRASYKDKFGPLGTIAVLGGRRQSDGVAIELWVMSCRAFSRRIEHRCLEQVFDRLEVDRIAFDFQATPRNSPMQQFLSGLLGSPACPGSQLSRVQFASCCPPLFHRLVSSPHG